MYMYCLYTRAHLICTIPLQMLMLKYKFITIYVVSYYRYFSKISLQGLDLGGLLRCVCVRACMHTCMHVCVCLHAHGQVHSCSSKRPWVSFSAMLFWCCSDCFCLTSCEMESWWACYQLGKQPIFNEEANTNLLQYVLWVMRLWVHLHMWDMLQWFLVLLVLTQNAWVPCAFSLLYI